VVMRIAFSVTLLVVGAGAWTGARAQGRSADADAVRARDDQERVAILNRDGPALERLWSDDFTVNAPSNQG